MMMMKHGLFVFARVELVIVVTEERTHGLRVDFVFGGRKTYRILYGASSIYIYTVQRKYILYSGMPKAIFFLWRRS